MDHCNGNYDAIHDSPYTPVEYTDLTVLTDGISHGWADPSDHRLVDFNGRLTFCGPLRFDASGRPLNPQGRTGITGRGQLGKWGPNQAADPILICGVRQDDLQILLIERHDNGKLALPGGMVDTDEDPVAAAKRELLEETSINADHLNFHIVFQGLVAEGRNTDNAWIETTAAYAIYPEISFPVAADDARTAAWYRLTDIYHRPLSGNHHKLIELAIDAINSEYS